jgi:cell wall-associated NlpC family hydrolase
MRRFTIVVLAAVSALTLISFAALTAGAQTNTSDQYPAEELPPQETTTAVPEETSADPEPYHQVVDNATEGRFDAPGWQTGPASDNTVGEDYAYADASDAGPARFTVDIPETGYYAVYARWPGGQDLTEAASFSVDTASGVQSKTINQRSDAGLWVLLGVHQMEQGERGIQISRSSADGRVAADAVLVVGDALVGSKKQPATDVNPYEFAGVDDAAAGGDTRLSAQGRRHNGRDVARYSSRHIGTRYVSSPPGRCRAFRAEDCSCHTHLVFKHFNRRLPDRGPDDQWRFGRRVDRSNLKPGDLVFWDEDNNNRLGDHDLVSIYSGGNNVIFASRVKGKVTELEMRFLNNYYGAKRLRPR